jgi:putative oxidoreductase
MVSLGLLVLRLAIGGLFMVHGYPKLFGGAGSGKQLSDETTSTLGEGFAEQMESGGTSGTAGMMESIDLPNPRSAAWALALAELVGGLALVAGFQTRPAAAALAFSQMVAINKVHAKEGLVGGYEYNISLIGGTVALALAGPGKLSLDR